MLSRPITNRQIEKIRDLTGSGSRSTAPAVIRALYPTSEKASLVISGTEYAKWLSYFLKDVEKAYWMCEDGGTFFENFFEVVAARQPMSNAQLAKTVFAEIKKDADLNHEVTL